jgi:hypothetical protein
MPCPDRARHAPATCHTTQRCRRTASTRQRWRRRPPRWPLSRRRCLLACSSCGGRWARRAPRHSSWRQVCCGGCACLGADAGAARHTTHVTQRTTHTRARARTRPSPPLPLCVHAEVSGAQAELDKRLGALQQLEAAYQSALGLRMATSPDGALCLGGCGLCVRAGGRQGVECRHTPPVCTLHTTTRHHTLHMHALCCAVLHRTALLLLLPLLPLLPLLHHIRRAAAGVCAGGCARPLPPLSLLCTRDQRRRLHRCARAMRVGS